MLQAEARALEVLVRLPSGPRRGVEVGVWRGEMSASLLRLKPDLFLYMVDNWLPSEERPESYRLSGDIRSQDDAETMADAARKAIAWTEAWEDRRKIFLGDSLDAADYFDDGSLDFVFLDAEHTYEAVSADIVAWLPKIRSGGLMSGHDYSPPGVHSKRGWPGVVRAVDEAAERYGWSLDLGAEATWFARVS